MKNPEAKPYKGSKNYLNLTQNVSNLYSLSDKQLENNNPFKKKVIMTESKGQGENYNVKNYFTEPLKPRGKLELKQINEVASRSFKIWQSSKKRLIQKDPAFMGKEGEKIDYWDLKRSSKSFSLSWKFRESILFDKNTQSFGTSYTSKNHTKLSKREGKKLNVSQTHKLFLPPKSVL